MKRVPKHKWIKELLSNYRQGKGYLKQKKIDDDDYRFSVLGVLTDIHIEHVDNKTPEDNNQYLPTWHRSTNEEGFTYWHSGEDKHRLSVALAKWAELPCNPILSMYLGETEVALPMSRLNDEFDFTFKEYAAAIKNQL